MLTNRLVVSKLSSYEVSFITKFHNGVEATRAHHAGILSPLFKAETQRASFVIRLGDSTACREGHRREAVTEEEGAKKNAAHGFL